MASTSMPVSNFFRLVPEDPALAREFSPRRGPVGLPRSLRRQRPTGWAMPEFRTGPYWTARLRPIVSRAA